MEKEKIIEIVAIIILGLWGLNAILLMFSVCVDKPNLTNTLLISFFWGSVILLTTVIVMAIIEILEP
jgi:hypothetical protein